MTPLPSDGTPTAPIPVLVGPPIDHNGPVTSSRRIPRLTRPWSVRARILVAVLLVTALGMVGAGLTSYLVARAQTRADVYASLRQETEEFRTSTQVALDPDTGVPVNGLEDLLSYAIKTTYPSDDEAVLGIVDGEVRKVPGADLSAHQLAVQEDAEFIAQASAVRPDQSPGVYRADTSAHKDLAYVSVPVRITGEKDLGHYVTAVDMTQAYSSINHAYLVYAYVAALTLVLVAVIGYGVSGRLLAPLRSLRTTAQRISETDLTDRIPQDQLSRGDEVADLGRTVNAMLDRLSTSFDSQRQALDDVGHELRTPITIIQGHQELLDVTDPQDVSATREITLEELDRMQRLVDDLLLLAKSRRPDFVRQQETDVDDLLLSVLDKVTPLGDRRWQLEETSGVRARLDPERVTQALVQLVANALRFTDDGGVIALGARVGPDHAVRIWVRDEGTGIEPDQQEQIFTRHALGDPDGQAHPHGAGLGLAIVTAIATAHGGEVELESVPGQGSRFTVVLPSAAPVAVPDDVPGPLAGELPGPMADNGTDPTDTAEPTGTTGTGTGNPDGSTGPETPEEGTPWQRS
jgi:two-component system OmpR family sensor kinase